MYRKIDIRLTGDDLGVLKPGDVIEDAEELGVVKSLRPHRRFPDQVVVFFEGGNCHREEFGIPQSLVVLRSHSVYTEYKAHELGYWFRGAMVSPKFWTGAWPDKYDHSFKQLAKVESLDEMRLTYTFKDGGQMPILTTDTVVVREGRS